MTRELLDEVLAHPDDDVPRRVYADWLSQRGDPRGELIAVQCELPKRDAKDPARRELELRELDLLREYGPVWIAELGLDSTVTATRRYGPVESAQVPTVMFHRGFPDAVKVSVGELAASRLDAAPIRRLLLTDVHDFDLTELPAIPTLRALQLRYGRVNMRALGNAPIIAGIDELALQSIYADDIRGLVEATLPALRKLTLDKVKLTYIGTLARASWISSLRELCIVDTLAVRELLLAKTWRDLERLELECALGDEDVAAIASSQLARGLEDLYISVSHIGEATIEAFSRSKLLGKLQRLVLRGRSDSDLAPLERRWGSKLVLL